MIAEAAKVSGSGWHHLSHYAGSPVLEKATSKVPDCPNLYQSKVLLILDLCREKKSINFGEQTQTFVFSI